MWQEDLVLFLFGYAFIAADSCNTDVFNANFFFPFLKVEKQCEDSDHKKMFGSKNKHKGSDCSFTPRASHLLAQRR